MTATILRRRRPVAEQLQASVDLINLGESIRVAVTELYNEVDQRGEFASVGRKALRGEMPTEREIFAARVSVSRLWQAIDAVDRLRQSGVAETALRILEDGR